ncbi:MAG: double-strand break repair protein AddB [Hyphomicrobiales bacterium]|nr:double-strand break repair protein AddB [Hyphomicrobiales bacterium]
MRERASEASASQEKARVVSIDAGRPFLPTLVEALLDGDLVPDFRFDGADPAALADVTLLLPTRRAARAAADALIAEIARRGFGRAVLMPDIRPFGDVDEDGALFGEDELDLAAAVPPFERRLIMTRLVRSWTRMLGATHPVTGAMPTLPTSPAEAVRLADALLVLMDQVGAQGSDWSRLADIVPEDHALYWQLTRAFLTIVTEAWPKHLEETGRVDPAARRHAAIRAAAARLAASPPKGPVIAAGSTGSVPSTAEMIATVARLPRGVAVLPGLDFDLDDAAWAALEPAAGAPGAPVPSHPQYGLRLLLDGMDLGRADVRRIGRDGGADAAARRRLVSEAMRPAETTEAWRDFAETIGRGGFDLDGALRGLALIEARHEAEEAVAVALTLREAIETPGATAALVTPDRNLARRVSAELARWGLEIDDSAGRPLGHTPPGALFRLVGEVALGGFEPLAVASLLAHPLARFGRSAGEARRLGRIVDLVALRGPRPTPGGVGLLAAFDEACAAIDAQPQRAAAARRRPSREDRAGARALLEDLVVALRPLEATAAATQPLAAWIAAQVAATRTVARDDAGSDAHLFAGEEGEALAGALAEAIRAAAEPATAMNLSGRDWPGVLDALVGDRPVNRRTAPGARLFVYGPLEARLLSFDLLVLAGLDEGIWPISTRSDPWLSRPMRRDMALDAPERRIGLSAHDFVQAATSRRVVLARASRSGGTPTVPSRWLQRLATVIGDAGMTTLRGRGAAHLALARRLDRGDGVARPIGRPNPRPDPALRPNRASVTEIETWIRDPYAIFARRILRLDPLDPIGREIGAAERGTFVHDVLATFVVEGHPFRGDAARERLLAIGEEKLAAFAAFPEAVALWRARLAAIAAWWLEAEVEHGAAVAERHAELGGRLELPVDGRPFRLTGYADRIDLTRDGAVRLLDYKTGAPPSEKQVQSLLAPQLPLEAAMVRAGGFDQPGDTAFAERAIAEIAYLHLSGGRDGGKWETRGKAKDDALGPEELAAAALERLEGLIRHFRLAETGWPSRPRVQFEKARSGPYDHLARVAEWAAGEAGEGGEG